MNLTGTMIWADFWSATEPLLAILCVSLPMLSSLFTRCTSRRGRSKIDPYHSSENGTHGSAFSKLRNPNSSTANNLPLENIYAANQKIHYQSAVAATTGTPEPDRDLEATHTGDSGSEVALTELEHHKMDGIRVQTKWTIQHD